MLIALVIFCCAVFTGVYGHGRLINPPQRSSAWRYGYEVPANYNDNELFCGGFQRQWNQNDGKCGTCGDPYDAKRENEAGGKYATGIITGSYVKGGVIDAEIEITANHKGWFEFRLCAHNKPSIPVTQECLDATVLTVIGSGKRFYLPHDKPAVFELQLQLPPYTTCTQCVLQWKYHAANNWGCDGDDCCVGCGNQEHFINCADIEIA